MRQWLLCLALLVGACTTTEKNSFTYRDVLGTRTCHDDRMKSAWPDVFPKSALSFSLGPELRVMFNGDESIQLSQHCWLSHSIVTVLDEGSLLPAAPGTERYRFTWMRSFHEYVVIRAEHLGPIHSLHVKMGSLRQGGFLVDRRLLLTPSQWKELLHRLEKARFWSADRYLLDAHMAYTDGATWLLEGVRRGSYHALNVDSPRPEGPAGAFRAACLYLVELSGLSIPAEDVY